MEKIKFTADQRAVALRSIQEMYSGLSHFNEMIKKDELYADMREAIPHNLEHYATDLFKAVGYDSDTEKKIKERYAEIKKANMRIHELERQMGEQGDVDMLPQVIKYLSDKIYSFWKKDGFGHVSEIEFGQYGNCRIKFSGMLFPHSHLTMSDTPETDKRSAAQWIQRLKDRGFVLVKESEHSRREEFVLDNDHNRALVVALITGRFPSAKVISIDSHLMFKKDDVFSIRNISAIIYNLSDI